MTRIALDIDGVCYDFVPSLRNYIHKNTGKPLEEMPAALTWNFFDDQWGYTHKEYVQFMKDGVKDLEIFWRGPIIDDCKEGILDLYRSGYEIVFITARNFEGIERMCQYATEYWIMSEGLPYHEIIVDNDKTNHNFDVLFDDAPHNIEASILHGQDAVVFDQPWNRHHTEFIRVCGWKELVEYTKENYPVSVADPI